MSQGPERWTKATVYPDDDPCDRDPCDRDPCDRDGVSPDGELATLQDCVGPRRPPRTSLELLVARRFKD